MTAEPHALGTEPPFLEPVPVAVKFARALLAVQPVAKSKTAKVSDTFQYRYATLTDTLQAVKAACAANGLAIAQTVVEHGDRSQIMTILICTETGDGLTYGGPVMPVKGEPQAMASALTYARRYALTTLFALNVEDDDGALAQRAATSPNSRTPAEVEVRRLVAGLDKTVRTEFVADFKAEFGVSLQELGESRHGDALTFTKWWIDPAVGSAQPEFDSTPDGDTP